MHLFVIRIWSEKSEKEEIEWRGKVQDVGSGKEGYFIGWVALVELLGTFVSEEDKEEE